MINKLKPVTNLVLSTSAFQFRALLQLKYISNAAIFHINKKKGTKSELKEHLNSCNAQRGKEKQGRHL